ncbi:MAG TPA: DUF4153 domain-containing protein [Puia sp.]|jgi:hypothetical protein|nr:DUF4153 domain-containing protein [Puia sp.]
MRFPSLQSLAGGAWHTFRRFPIAILLAAKATALGIWLNHVNETHNDYVISGARTAIPAWFWNAIVSCYLGMLLSVAASVWVEKKGTRTLAIALQAAVLILAGLYYWSLPAEHNVQMVLRTVVLALGLHWLIAVIGFGRGEVNGFWNFNKQLFLRILMTWLYATVLYIGIALALLAIDRLFNVNVHWEVYSDCWWVLAGIFSIWLFLAGFPTSYANPEVISDYPRGLKIFTQYVLLPLVTVYLLILYAYMFKIIFTAHWPSGWVGWMVMAFSVAGILSLLLIYPLRNEESNTWIRSYSQIFYFALLPLIGLLFCAIYKRVVPYGITEQRYFLLALALWLLFITLYFLLSRKKDIRLVPLTLCILAFLSCWGPWGAFSVSMHSQRHRLQGMLEKYGLLVNGKVVAGKTHVEVSLKDRKAISSEVDYIVGNHGYKPLQPWFNSNLDSLLKGKDDRFGGPSQDVVKLMGVEYAYSWTGEIDMDSTSAATTNFYCNVTPDDSVLVADGAVYVANFKIMSLSSGVAASLGIPGARLKINLSDDQKRIEVGLESGDGSKSVVDLMPVSKLVMASKDVTVNFSPGQLTLPLTGGSYTGKVVLTELSGTRADSTASYTRIGGMILFSPRH